MLEQCRDMSNTKDFYKDILNTVEIQNILKKYNIVYDKETDVEFFDELIYGIEEDYPNVANLSVVLERILIYLVNRDMKF
mgnify:CR=1 FL=1